MLLDFDSTHALLLQGPNGPFFHRFAKELEQRGMAVTKVNFNAADALFFRGRNAISYREPMEQWPSFLRNLLRRSSIDIIFLFGDCRPLHRQATAVAAELGVPVWMFEEGYLRPHWITLEQGGVNGNSRMPKDPEYYRHEAPTGALPAVVPVGHTFGYAALWTILTAMAITLLGWRYPHYRHHRDFNLFRQTWLWGRGFLRKSWYRHKERDFTAHLRVSRAQNYFFVPLQVHCDAQLDHSPYADVEEFIVDVVTSFAQHAPADAHLILKHHPMDLAYRDYGPLLCRLGSQYDCAERLLYVHDVHLPTLLRYARGTITMNSTVGLSSLQEGTPVKVMGAAIYDLPKLVCQRPLAEFFTRPGTVDKQLCDAFCRWLRASNQINGSFYKRLEGATTASGLNPTTPGRSSSASNGHKGGTSLPRWRRKPSST